MVYGKNEMKPTHIFLPMSVHKEITHIMHVNMTKSFMYYANSSHARLTGKHTETNTHTCIVRETESET